MFSLIETDSDYEAGAVRRRDQVFELLNTEVPEAEAVSVTAMRARRPLSGGVLEACR